MRKTLIASLLGMLSLAAHAQYIGTVPPNADVKFSYTEDTDKFKFLNTWIGAAHESGFGARIGYFRYDGRLLNGSALGAYYPATNVYVPNESTGADSSVKAQGETFQLTYVNIGENHNFHGAIGVKNVQHSTDVKVSPKANAQYDEDPAAYVRNQLTSNGGQLSGTNQYVVADAELRLTMTDSLTIGLSAATDVVESARSLQTGTTYLYTGGDVDLLLDDNLSLNVAVGNIHFSDNNDRLFLKTKTTWTFLPEYGLSAFVKTKTQSDSNPGGTNYFSPDSLNSGTLGLQIRKAYDGLVYTAAIEHGREWAKTVDGSQNTNPIYVWSLGVQTYPGKKTGTTFGVTLIGSNTSISGSGTNYNWYNLNSWMKVPF